ncbi:hypothetical protein D9757_015063 [Collybiopsis confluens]|uniref:Fungal-type protein kinase domain-containing protein n=1 Tax=Collybiopsis confluens TaxID=2823264 RepID=A0A8H5FPT7_9AGAR|nr:hypothetical protein D9757_015063 [Collybiopsis confluens]
MSTTNPMSTPTKNTSVKLHDTPAHARMSSTLPFTTSAQEYDAVFVLAAEEMSGKYFGPISPSEFLDYYLPNSDEIPPLPQLDTSKFAEVASKAVENQMYGPMISALQPFCKDITLFNSSNSPDSPPPVFHGRLIKPDISFYANSNMPSPDHPTDSSKMLGFLEFKNNLADEPFVDGGPKFEPDVARPRDTRGQIAVYNTSIAASQFRTRVFSAFINRSSCRLMCATRSGTSVTRSFDYTTDPSLATFFWRLSHSSPETRGIDSTFIRMTQESAEFKAAYSSLHLKDTAAVYKVSVVDEVSGKTSFFLVSEPFTASHFSPTGRCSRCFLAYDAQREKVVLLKDHWRVDGYDPEGRTYRALNSIPVPHIPNLVTAGDVLGHPGSTCGNEVFLEHQQRRIHHHYRLVLDTVGHSLTHFESTWQLVRAVLDALIGRSSRYTAISAYLIPFCHPAHRVAFEKGSRLHRDISVGNIIITDEGRGMLIDWELSKDVKQEVLRSFERTGTWQFKSIRLLEATDENPVEHTVGDDIESFLWVLSWVVVEMHRRKPGGSAKKMQLRSGGSAIRDLKLATLKVTDLLSKLWKQFGGRYGSDRFTDMTEASSKAASEWLQTLESHDWTIKQLNAALADEEWKTLKDPRITRLLPKTSKILTERQNKRKSTMTEYGPLPLPKKPRVEPAVSQG